MKFARHLAMCLTPEWRKQFIEYEKLSTTLQTTALYQTSKSQFFNECLDELNKIELFYNQKLAEAHAIWSDLRHETLARKKTAATGADRKKFGDYVNLVTGHRSKKRGESSPKVGEKEADDRSHSGEAPKKEKAAAATAGGKLGTTAAAADDEWDEEREPKTLKQLKSSFAEFYRSLVLLQNYQDLNVKGFKRLMFKSDKMFKSTAGDQWYKDRVEKAKFFHTKDVDDLISRIEQFVTLHLVDGDKNLAMKILRIPPLNEIQSAWTTGRLGFFGGTFVSLCLFLILFVMFNREISDEPKWLVVRLFRGHFLVFFNIFLISINVFGWQTNGVNHILIFEIDPREHLTYQGLMEISFMLLTLWVGCALGYISSRQTSIPATIFPLSLTIISLSWLVFPLPVFNRPSRWWFVKRLFYVCSPPFHFVAFADFWLADQMNSLTTVFLDLQYTICFYSFYVDYGDRWSIRYLNNAVNNQTLSVVDKVGAYSWEGIDRFTGVDACVSHIHGIRPFVACIPAILRLAQCLRRWYDSGHYSPHVYNAGKYSTTFFIVFFGWLNSLAKSNWNQRSFYYPWVLAYAVGYIYAFIWDIKMDWSLFDRHGDDLIYSKHWYYYAAMAADGILRLAWILNVSLGDATILEADRLLLITSILECVRRFIWNFFRLENEHATNCGKFRATLDINIKSMPAKRSPSPQAKKQDAQAGATAAAVKQEMEKAVPAPLLPPLPPAASDAGLFHASLKPPAVIGFPPMINRHKKYASLIPPKIQFNPPITSTWTDNDTTRSFKLLNSVKEAVDEKEKQPTNDKTAANSPKS